ncbi:glycosyltransferase family 4 protein [Gonapodya prolifera JEL478]|uniref:Glycosyltransferase family 4 protein n=1 Tax=Gonapodya prolifera (strain JEL478) TaxID=1344416 RepID=A0A139ARS5_GONPJ|nr:glycosyltransferase family 4 protein [Gonapodya prolifera JEL478]|eukprot:KXS19440.1 glycosyltransferase family 4 protein [Gonapodya prolifera JEL478]
MAPTPPYPSTRPRPLSLPTARRPRVVLHMRSASHLAGKSPTVTIEDGEVDADVDEMKHSMALLMREAENQATASRDSSHYTLASSMNTLLDSTPPPAHSEKHSESTRLTSLERKYLCHRLPVLDRRVLRTFGVYMGQWKNVAWPSEPWHCDLLVMPLREAWEWAEFAKSGTVLPFSVLEEDIKRNTAAMKTEVKAVGKSGVRGQDENGTSPSLGASGKQINGDAEDNSATSESDNESDAGSSHIGESQGGFAMVRRAISRMSSKKVAGQGDPTSEDRDPKTGALGAIMRVLSKKQTSDSHRKFGDEISEKDTRLKISPVVNGMSVARFQPNVAAELEKPTAIMLSHVSPVKGVAGAIAAAGVIVNELGFRNFELHIYGSTEKDSAYTAACTSLISSLNLTNHVFLKGVASPASVLPQGWVFVNSSITEGLPLALGEAGLCGLPVVCTDVGGSREVVSDLRSGTVYGAIVPPGQAQQLARAILSVLAVADGLDAVAGESFVAPVKLVDYLSRGESGVTELEARITDPRVKEARRRLGMLLRERTIRTFSLAKFLRVHEQVMYLGTAYSGYKANRV